MLRGVLATALVAAAILAAALADGPGADVPERVPEIAFVSTEVCDARNVDGSIGGRGGGPGPARRVARSSSD